MTLLRAAGDFQNKSIVEYATVKVDVLSRFLPSNLRDPGYSDEDMVRGLYVSPAGRLTWKELYLNSTELAEKFVECLHVQFEGRTYAKAYSLRVEVQTTTQTVTATKGKAKHSPLVAAFIETASLASG